MTFATKCSIDFHKVFKSPLKTSNSHKFLIRSITNMISFTLFTITTPNQCLQSLSLRCFSNKLTLNSFSIFDNKATLFLSPMPVNFPPFRNVTCRVSWHFLTFPRSDQKSSISACNWQLLFSVSNWPWDGECTVGCHKTPVCLHSPLGFDAGEREGTTKGALVKTPNRLCCLRYFPTFFLFLRFSLPPLFLVVREPSICSFHMSFRRHVCITRSQAERLSGDETTRGPNQPYCCCLSIFSLPTSSITTAFQRL